MEKIAFDISNVQKIFTQKTYLLCRGFLFLFCFGFFAPTRTINKFLEDKCEQLIRVLNHRSLNRKDLSVSFMVIFYLFLLHIIIYIYIYIYI